MGHVLKVHGMFLLQCPGSSCLFEAISLKFKAPHCSSTPAHFKKRKLCY